MRYCLHSFAVLALAFGAAAWVSHDCPMTFFNSTGNPTMIVRYCR